MLNPPLPPRSPDVPNGALVGILLLSVLLAACSSNDASSGPVSTVADLVTTDVAPATSTTTSPATSRTTEQADTNADRPETALADGSAVEPADWSDCGALFQCAVVAVPLDHEVPDGPTIDLSLLRIAATGEAVGSIFVNLGGPGASTLSAMRGGFGMDDATMASYHLVGFDPRGIGESSPLSCTVDLADGLRPDFSPDNDEEQAALDAAAEELAERCQQLDGDLLPHVGTESVVGDLELLRQAVGDDALNYIGLSYGTVIGLRYADRHPDLVGRMVLDGIVDPAFSLPDLLRQQAIEFERAFLTMDAACGSVLVCPEGGIAAGYDRLLAELEANGVEDVVGPAELQVATLLAMYSERLWPQYSAALVAAEAGNFADIERLHDLYVGGVSFEAYAAVSCVDSRSPVGPKRWDAFADELAVKAPRFGAALANELRTCAYWPVAPTSEPKPVTAVGANPILVVSTTGDAPTPLTNAITVAATLSAAGVVTVEDEGHTAYGKDFCVDRIVADYFATGEVPDDVHRC